MNTFNRLLTSLAVILTIAVVVRVGQPAVRPITFDDVIATAEQAQTATFTASMYLCEPPGQYRVPLISTCIMIDSGRKFRLETDWIFDVVAICDFDQKQVLVTFDFADDRTAMLHDLGDEWPELADINAALGLDVSSLVGVLRELDTHEIGHRMINDANCIGFGAMFQGARFEFWVDPRTAVPMQVVVFNDPVAIDETAGTFELETMMVLDHFQYNVAFDKSTFSLDPPEGYSLQRMQ